MKRLLTLICFASFLGLNHQVMAQDMASNADLLDAYKKRSPLYDYTESNLNNIDSVPDFQAKAEKLIITGTIYESDGITPAKDVILYVFQPDDKGNYNMKRDSSRKRYVHHRAWVKTDADGKYTIYTFMPGKLFRSKELKQIHRIIKEPGKPEQELAPFFFNDDPLIPELTLACQAEAAMSMLRINEKDGVFVATKDFKLAKTSPTDL
jgi:protocatechuate 3,4-dioxygenase, beta subunit